jgi:hypothetical protein
MNNFNPDELPKVIRYETKENPSNVVYKKVIRLTSRDGKFPCPHVKYIGQLIRVDLTTMCQYDVINPLNGQTEKKVTIELVNESGAKTGVWTLIEAIVE